MSSGMMELAGGNVGEYQRVQDIISSREQRNAHEVHTLEH